jgi:hypothetical protein
VGLADGRTARPTGVRETQLPYKVTVEETEGPPWLVDGKWVYTKDGKPRKPGALRGKYPPVALSDLETPDWLIDIMEGSEDDFSDLLPFDESQLPPEFRSK